MSYISKYDTKFITFVNKKRNKNFKFFDDYILWLFYKEGKCNKEIYYAMLEKDIWDYSDMQTGTPREHEHLNNDWKNIEKDPYGLYKNNDNYIKFIKRVWENEKK